MPVMMCTGMCRVSGWCLSRSSTAQPSMPGMSMSSVIASGSNACASCEPSFAVERDEPLESLLARHVEQDASRSSTSFSTIEHDAVARLDGVAVVARSPAAAGAASTVDCGASIRASPVGDRRSCLAGSRRLAGVGELPTLARGPTRSPLGARRGCARRARGVGRGATAGARASPRRRAVATAPSATFPRARRRVAVRVPDRRILRRQEQRERAALARRALDADLAAEQPRDLAADRQAEPRAAELAARRAVRLLERLEDQLLLVLRDADAGVASPRTRSPPPPRSSVRAREPPCPSRPRGSSASRRPARVNLNAFESRFLSTCCSRWPSV